MFDGGTLLRSEHVKKCTLMNISFLSLELSYLLEYFYLNASHQNILYLVAGHVQWQHMVCGKFDKCSVI
jgi:hypothetical protein